MIQPKVSSQTYRKLIEDCIDDVNNLRPFPAMATKLMESCKEANVNIKTIIQLIECDPTVATKVLSLSNSPLYGTSRPITTIGHAVVILGFQTVSKVAVSIATSKVFMNGCPATERYRKRIFNESIGCATTSRILASLQDDTNPDEAFLVGIMQDIGQLVFLDVVPDEYVPILDQEILDNPVAIETESFGIDHATVGRSCGSNWGLPNPINFAISNHHQQFSDIDHDLSKVTVLSNYYARKWQLGFSEDHIPEPSPEMDSRIPADALEEIEAKCRETYQAVNEVCAI